MSCRRNSLPFGCGQVAAFPVRRLPHHFHAVHGETQISRSTKMVRDVCRHRQSGPDRLENQPTAPAALGGKACYFGDRALVYVSRIMMTSLRSKCAAGKAVRAGLAVGGRISPHHYTGSETPKQQESKNGAGRNRRAARPPAHFQRNPLCRSRLAVFPRCSLGPYQFRNGHFARALKNSQLTRRLPGDVTIILRDGTLG